MFYEIDLKLTEIEANQIDCNKLTVGCISSEELKTLGIEFGFDEETIDASFSHWQLLVKEKSGFDMGILNDVGEFATLCYNSCIVSVL